MQYLDFHTHHLRLEPDVLSIVQYDHGKQLVPSSGVRYSVGIHPWTITSAKEWVKQMQWVEKNLQQSEILAVGECGLDFHHNENKQEQVDCFREMVRLSEMFKKPMIIHCVKAFNQLIELYDELRPTQGWAIHQFRGKPELADQLLRRGIFLSFSFSYNGDTIDRVPLNQLFLETDDREGDIRSLYNRIAEHKRQPLLTIQNAIWDNYKRFFFE